MAQRTYDDPCRIALTMDLVGERWALLVVRELIFGPKRFRDLRVGLPNASQNVLSQRLRELEENGIVRRVELGPPASTHVYELTERGRQLEPVLIALSRWGAQIPSPQDAETSTDAFMLLLKALHLPPAREVPTLAVRLVVGTDSFDVEVSPTSVEVTRGAHAHVQATARADVPTLWKLISTDLTVAAAVDAGTLDVTGDRSVAQRFFTFFGLPRS
ncbi:HxlR family transcriptional regulator [Micromonospora pisi]|uniref:HxlR family transcriptional regulator n=1 Tax=Micromonospora pisi TaxID=589240 RepID=A0A495JUT5_9ACTN|nr:helix-turn-helix domain-containing protein [Micromonospora pisi]RKR92305.1 HxlR family transcriptional regulator [Micromonospora pisi]